MTSTPEDEGGPPDLVDTIASPKEYVPPSPAPKTRKARWSAFEKEILQQIILPKLRSTFLSSNPTSVQAFLVAYRRDHEPDISQVDFQSYLDGLGIKTVRITVFEGLLPSAAAVPPAHTFPSFEEVTPRAPRRVRRELEEEDDGAFDNESPHEFAPHEIDPFMPPEAGDSFLNSLGPDPGILNS